MAVFYLSKNRETRVQPEAQLVQWLSRLSDNYHALLEVIGTDFRSRCILVKFSGIFNILPDQRPYISARKIGPWLLSDGTERENPIRELSDQSDKIREFMLQESDKLFPDKARSPEFKEALSLDLIVLGVAVLTYVFPEKARKPLTDGYVFCQFGPFQTLIDNWSLKQRKLPALILDGATIRRMADLLGLEQVKIGEVFSTSRPTPVIQNPYHYNSEVGPQMFRGRAEEIRTARICLGSSPSMPVALVGLQRTGKSSLGREIIRQFVDESRVRAIRYVLGNFSQNEGSADIAGYLLQSFREKDKQYITKYSEGAKRRRKEVGLEREMFKSALRALKRATGIDTILFLDELHKLAERTAGPGHETFADFLEDIAKDETLGLKLIISVRPTVFTQHERIRRTNLLKLFEHVKVASVENDAALQIINLGQPPLEYEDPAVKRILFLSGSNPYWIQLICFKVFLYVYGRRKGNRVSEQDVDSVFHGLLTGIGASAYFSALYQDIQTLGPPFLVLQKVVALAEDEGMRVSCADVAAQAHFDRDSVNRHLEPLFNHEILVKYTNCDPVMVSFKAEALRQWLRYSSNLSLRRRAS